MSQKKPVHNLKGFSGLFPLELYLGLKYFQTITRCKFHNKPHAIKELIDRYVFSHIFDGYTDKNLHCIVRVDSSVSLMHHDPD